VISGAGYATALEKNISSSGALPEALVREWIARDGPVLTPGTLREAPGAQPDPTGATEQIRRKHQQAKIDANSRTAGDQACKRHREKRCTAPRATTSPPGDALTAMNHRDPAHCQTQQPATPAASPNEMSPDMPSVVTSQPNRCGGSGPCLSVIIGGEPALSCHNPPR